ncbi:MAG: alginate export family protein [Cellvibrionaceae bacterium]|nr:alginate export family protein [Cellvibrionaceae bacterium]
MKKLLVASVVLGLAGLGFSAVSHAKAPKWKFLRWSEDWSKYEVENYKKAKLSEDGEVWVSLGGHMRYRGESWTNFGFNKKNDDVFHVVRATGHADFHFGKKARVFVELKTANATDRDLPGGRRPLDVDTFALQQAFVDYELKPSLRLRIGRQSFSFGKQRLISPLPWGNSLRTWDGVRLDYKGDNWTTTAFASQFAPVRLYEVNKASENHKLNGLYLASKKSPFTKDFYLYHASDNGDMNLYTLGSLMNWKRDAWNLNLELALQMGDSAGDKDVSAAMMGTELGFNVNGSFIKKLFVGLDYGSGDGNPGDGDHETFNQLYPLGHAYLGFADHIGRMNVRAVTVGMIAKPSAQATLRLALQSFYKDNKNDNIYNAGGGILRPAAASKGERHIANELDLTLVYALNKDLKFLFGASYLSSGDAIEASGVDEDVKFAYWQANYMF